MLKIIKKWATFDYLLFLAIIILLALSLSILYSLQFNNEAAVLVFRKQIVFSFLGILLFFMVSKINYKIYFTYSKLIYLIGIISLLLVLFLGTEIRGTTGWIKLGFLGVQPVEFVKLALIIYLARYFSENGDSFKLFRYIFISGMSVFLCIILIILQWHRNAMIVVIIMN